MGRNRRKGRNVDPEDGDGPKAYADLGDLEEDQRIDIIGQTVMRGRLVVGVCVDDVPGKPERYIEKLKKRYPGIRILDQFKGPVKGVVTIRVAPPDPEMN